MSLWLLVNDAKYNMAPSRLINLDKFIEYRIGKTLTIKHPDGKEEIVYGLYGYLEYPKTDTTSSVVRPAEKVLLANFKNREEAEIVLQKIMEAMITNRDQVSVVVSTTGYYVE